jgi:queuine tRNA-ribosyltransferase
MVMSKRFPDCARQYYKDLRIQSAEYIANARQQDMHWRLVSWEPAEEMYAMTEVVCDILPEDKPRYLMGVERQSIF